jgi:preprotein translocase subunit YajC
MLTNYIVLMTPAQGQGGQAPNPVMQFLPFILIALVFYFMIFRPQKKRQKDRQAIVDRMEKGDKVVTSSGIHGTITAIEDGTVLVQVSDTTKIRFEKASITTVTPKNAQQPTA